MQIQKVKIGKLKPNPENPRIIKDDAFHKLVKSIQEFPEMLEIRPIVVNKDWIIIGGNMRYRAAVEAGLKEIHCIYADKLTNDQENEFIIKDNVSGGEWDWDVLANEWDQETLIDWGVNIPHFNQKDNIDHLHSNSEFVGMPEFEAKDTPYKIVISFDSEEDMQEYAKISKLKFVTKASKVWSTWWPFKERADLSSVKFDQNG